MHREGNNPATPQRPHPAPLDDAAATPSPSRLGLLQTPPRRPGRGLKRAMEAEAEVPEHHEASPRGLLQTPPLRPPRRARFSTGPIDLSTAGTDATSDADRPVARKEEARSFASNPHQGGKHHGEGVDDDGSAGRDENTLEHSVESAEQLQDDSTDGKPDGFQVTDSNKKEQKKKCEKEQSDKHKTHEVENGDRHTDGPDQLHYVDMDKHDEDSVEQL
ncbi:hypothetical protein CH63R_14227 [Colletotrichum higginsianum IMI 349063]|uniref:Uncharacterized protein n=1 Tax=Colletotrichum higginsianum (strain IMI 349063) TaxID=759273 RepID=A0A1B7XTB1_COLHI|nr:hypothetical protein CH63R_14227 [Colletotrichum higginsianum IMI 349063]OBR03001.1 hypothetical protein CH63R_14227 [Colletotrichum higginsianum IMI 349063]